MWMAASLNVRRAVRKVWYFGYDHDMSISPDPYCTGIRRNTATSRSGSRNGSGLRRVALTTLKIAVVAPMPTARIRIAMAANPGFDRSMRRV